jgi:hypothetical protein
VARSESFNPTDRWELRSKPGAPRDVSRDTINSVCRIEARQRSAISITANVRQKGSQPNANNKEFVIRYGGSPGDSREGLPRVGGSGSEYSGFPGEPFDGNILVHIVADNPLNTKKVLDAERLAHKERLLRLSFYASQVSWRGAASRLGAAKININHAYRGLEPGTKAPLLIFAVAGASRVLSILAQTAEAKGASFRPKASHWRSHHRREATVSSYPSTWPRRPTGIDPYHIG